MKRDSRQGFIFSALLHGAMIVGVVLVTIYKPPQKPAVTVFELVSLPAPSPDDAEDDDIEFTVPQSRPQQPRPRPQPERRPEPPPPTPQKTPTPKQPLPRPPEKISYEEFLKKQGPPKATQPKTTQPRPINVPRIDTRFTATLRESVINLDSLSNLTDAEQSALDGYIARLKAALKRVWDKPAGLAHSVATVVEFEVGANGRLSGARITKSSGNAQFDQSVLDSFVTLGTAGTTPDGGPLRLRLTFRMTEE
jgi:TonB family protein